MDAMTRKYYEHWLGEEGCLLGKEYTRVIYSHERNLEQRGYPACLDLYVWVEEGKRVVSYGDAIKEKIEQLAQQLESVEKISEMSVFLSNLYETTVNHQIKYSFRSETDLDCNHAVTLTTAHYQDYENFFRACHPQINTMDWLQEYFEEMTQNRYCVGIYQDEKLVSCSDAPDMPYMTDVVQEIGINTLNDYRGNGYAAAVCSQAIKNILANGKIPQWSTTIDNIGSQKLAQRIGFVKVADVFTLSVSK